MAGGCNKDESTHTRGNSICAGTYSHPSQNPRCNSSSVASGRSAGCNADGGTLDNSIATRACICTCNDVTFGISADRWVYWGTVRRGKRRSAASRSIESQP